MFKKLKQYWRDFKVGYNYRDDYERGRKYAFNELLFTNWLSEEEFKETLERLEKEADNPFGRTGFDDAVIKQVESAKKSKQFHDFTLKWMVKMMENKNANS